MSNKKIISDLSVIHVIHVDITMLCDVLRWAQSVIENWKSEEKWNKVYTRKAIITGIEA